MTEKERWTPRCAHVDKLEMKFSGTFTENVELLRQITGSKDEVQTVCVAVCIAEYVFATWAKGGRVILETKNGPRQELVLPPTIKTND